MDDATEALRPYSAHDLALALAARLAEEVHEFAAVVEDIAGMLKDREIAEAGATLYPRLSAAFQTEIHALLVTLGRLRSDCDGFLETVHEVERRAADVRVRYQSYAAEVRDVLETIEKSPRG